MRLPPAGNPAALGIAGIAFLLACVGDAGTAASQPAADFYRSQRTLTMVVGSSTGGGYDGYARMFARHMGKYLPGNPTIIVSNMPGAAGMRAANHLYNVAAKDGTVLLASDRGVPTRPLFYGDTAAKFEATRFGWIGSAQRDVGLGVVSSAARVRTIDDIRNTEVVVGANGVDSDASLFPSILNELAGTRFRIVPGYLGLTEVILAVQRGEVHGMFMSGWGGPTTENALMLQRTGTGHIFVQLATESKAEMAHAPLIVDLIPGAEDKQMVATILSRLDLGRPFLAPPGVPPDRLAMLRDAFAKAASDPELVAEANKTTLFVNPISGADAQALIQRVYATPQPIIDRARKLLTLQKK